MRTFDVMLRIAVDGESVPSGWNWSRMLKLTGSETVEVTKCDEVEARNTDLSVDFPLTKEETEFYGGLLARVRSEGG